MTSREKLIEAIDDAICPLWFGNTAELDEAVRHALDAVEPLIRADERANIVAAIDDRIQCGHPNRSYLDGLWLARTIANGGAS